MGHLKPPPKFEGQLYESPKDAVIGPAEERALADARRAMRHPSYMNPDHPRHDQQVEGVRDLMVSVYGTPEEIAARLEQKGSE